MNTALTQKEAIIVHLVAEGMRNKEIAPFVHTTESVVKNYLRVIYDKCGVWNRLELALWYIKQQPVELSQNADGDLYFEI